MSKLNLSLIVESENETKDILMDMFKEKNITIRNYADTSFRITIGTSEENEMVLDVLRRFEYANS